MANERKDLLEYIFSYLQLLKEFSSNAENFQKMSERKILSKYLDYLNTKKDRSDIQKIFNQYSELINTQKILIDKLQFLLNSLSNIIYQIDKCKNVQIDKKTETVINTNISAVNSDKLNNSMKAILKVLISFNKEKFEESIGRIAKLVEIDRRTAKKYILKMQELGYLKVKIRERRKTYFDLEPLFKKAGTNSGAKMYQLLKDTESLSGTKMHQIWYKNVPENVPENFDSKDIYFVSNNNKNILTNKLTNILSDWYKKIKIESDKIKLSIDTTFKAIILILLFETPVKLKISENFAKFIYEIISNYKLEEFMYTIEYVKKQNIKNSLEGYIIKVFNEKYYNSLDIEEKEEAKKNFIRAYMLIEKGADYFSLNELVELTNSIFNKNTMNYERKEITEYIKNKIESMKEIIKKLLKSHYFEVDPIRLKYYIKN